MSKTLSFLAGAATGAAAAYFLDPQGGAQRRNQSRDKALASVKSTAGNATSATKQAAQAAKGKVVSAAPSVGKSEPPDDITLARKVETEIFRDAGAPKGQVSVSAENGVVFLRGEVEDQTWIDRLGSEAEQVDGVQAVRNLLHRPGTEAPVAPGTS
jgi:osmotically-inducible protein OsmY